VLTTAPSLPTQVVLVPISPKGPEKAPEQHAELMAFVEKAKASLRKAGIRTHVDTRFNLKPGAKFFEWEKRGVPLRIECGPRDVESGALLCARRTPVGGDKFTLKLDDGFAAAVQAELDTMQAALLDAAKERMRAHTLEPASYAEMSKMLEDSDGSSAPGFFLVPWTNDKETEVRGHDCDGWRRDCDRWRRDCDGVALSAAAERH
jgi:prolyl-tRNA synthetase